MTTVLNQLFVYLLLPVYLAAAVCYFAGLKNTGTVRPAMLLARGGMVVNLIVLVSLTILTGRLPLASGYEFLLSFTGMTVLLYLIYESKTGAQIQGGGGAVMLIAALLSGAAALLMPGRNEVVGPLMPALQSPWLTVHVFTAVVAYACFALAAGLGIMQLKDSDSPGNEASLYRIVATGFTLLSLSIVLGAVWAEQAWGSYWSWDPKETWALITWIIYVLYLHLHRQKGWTGKTASIMVIAGFIIVLFTFFGVNYLMSGLHSYA